MKLKKLLSGFLAAAMAVTTMVTASVTAGAATETTFPVSTGANGDDDWVFVKITDLGVDAENADIANLIFSYTSTDTTSEGAWGTPYEVYDANWSKIAGDSLLKTTTPVYVTFPYNSATMSDGINFQVWNMTVSSMGVTYKLGSQELELAVDEDESVAASFTPVIPDGTKYVVFNFTSYKAGAEDGYPYSQIILNNTHWINTVCNKSASTHVIDPSLLNETNELKGHNIHITSVDYYGDLPVATKHTITIAPVIADGSVTSDKDEAEADETVTLTADPVEGYELEKFTVTKSAGGAVTVTMDATDENKGTFTMPDDDVTVTASFTEIEVPAEPGELTISKSTLTIEDWKTTATTTLTAAVAGDEAAVITWETSDATVATVANGVVTFKKRGIVTITAKTGEGVQAQSKTCVITVNEKETVTAQKPLPTETKADGTKVRNEVLVITAAQAASAKSVTITVTDRNTGKKTEKTVTECYKTVKYTAADGTTDTISGGSNYLIAVTVTGIPAGVDPADVEVTFVVNEA